MTFFLQTALLLTLLPVTRTLAAHASAREAPFADNVQLRGSLNNARLTFLVRKKGTVAFLGGSITEMDGYRPLVCDLLKRRFPGAQFTCLNAGIASTCSTTGAFRLATDVLAHGPVDLLFVEFAVNDDQDAHHTRQECIRGLEGIIRHARRQNPNLDIVVSFFVNEAMLKTLQSGKTPLTIAAHSAVAAHYQVPTINLAREVAEEIRAGTLTWQQYGGVHPAPYGNALCARMIEELFCRAWSEPAVIGAAPASHPLPTAPLDPLNYERGRFLDPKEALIVQGWTVAVPDWSHLPGGKRERFTKLAMLCATEPGAEARLAFSGTAVGAYVVSGPDAGIVEASIDGSAYRAFDLYVNYSQSLHYPHTVLFGAGLTPGKHTLVLRMSQATTSGGHAARVMQFVVNAEGRG